MTVKSKKVPNRPHCLYLWFLHGMPVCSEEKCHRQCPYPFWKCPVKSHRPGAVQPMVVDTVPEMADSSAALLKPELSVH
ncbi:MAG: hypothetical protein GX268_08850 [Methanomicrobiales archaeon]|nr:hypothetical protein [Methanomicrobiales archaeon]